MFLTSKQNNALNLQFGFEMDHTPKFVPEGRHGCFYVLSSREVDWDDPPDAVEITLRHTLDRALDQALLMSETGARELETALNRHLPAVWPGDAPIELELVLTGIPDSLSVKVPASCHNRVHRFPFEDGFLVCPVPDCTGAPDLRGFSHSITAASVVGSYVTEHTCDAGHHWQCVFKLDGQVTEISVVRLKRANFARHTPLRS